MNQSNVNNFLKQPKKKHRKKGKKYRANYRLTNKNIVMLCNITSNVTKISTFFKFLFLRVNFTILSKIKVQ